MRGIWGWLIEIQDIWKAFPTYPFLFDGFVAHQNGVRWLYWLAKNKTVLQILFIWLAWLFIVSTLHPILQIKWQERHFHFKKILFGLIDAPRVFTIIMKKIVKHIGEVWNIRCVIYLDDLLLLHEDKNYIKQICGEISKYLSYMGWTINIEKSPLETSKKIWVFGVFVEFRRPNDYNKNKRNKKHFG